jgi:hypothetical protein
MVVPNSALITTKKHWQIERLNNNELSMPSMCEHCATAAAGVAPLAEQQQ